MRVVAQMTGLSQAEAGSRVESTIVSARENIKRARRNAVVLAFMAGAAAMVGAAVAWIAACAGGRDRDGGKAAFLWAPRPLARPGLGSARTTGINRPA